MKESSEAGRRPAAVSRQGGHTHPGHDMRAKARGAAETTAGPAMPDEVATLLARLPGGTPSRR